MGEKGIASGSLSDRPFSAAPSFQTFGVVAGPGSAGFVFADLARAARDACLALARDTRN